MNVRKAFEYSNFKCKPIDIDYLIEHVDEYDIGSFELDVCMQLDDVYIAYTDNEHPVSYVDSVFYKKTLAILSEYYVSNKEKVDKLIVEICKRTKQSLIRLKDVSLISSEVIDTIASNGNIKEVELAPNSGYVLDFDTYKKLKDSGHITDVYSGGVCEELKDNFDEMISYNQMRHLVCGNGYNSLQQAGCFFFTSEVSDEEIENIKYIRDGADIYIVFDNCHRVAEIINRLYELGRSNKIKVNIDEKNAFNEYLFTHVNEFHNMRDIIVSYTGLEHDMATYLKYEKRLVELVRPAMNLSPFEKYLYAYNITKHFKEYNESEEDKQKSRDLYKILDNEYMVCVGYSKLLGDLLDKLGIPNYSMNVTVETGLDDVPEDALVIPDYIENKKTKEVHEVVINGEGHARRKVHIVDSKYGIDGYYFADPTWDNDLQHDTYNYACMVGDEYIGLDRYNYLDVRGHSELFFVHSLEEFYYKLNILLDKNPLRDVNNYIHSLYKEFELLDSEFAKELKSKYPKIDRYNNKDVDKETIQSILLDIGERIVEKSNKMIDGNSFREAIRVLYENFYGISEEEVMQRVEETMEYNRTRQNKAFPVRYKVDGELREPVMNQFNKFDCGDSTTHKVA